MTPDREDNATEGIAQLAELVMSQESVQSVLELVVGLAQSVIGVADAASITVRRGDRYSTVAKTVDILDEIDAVQYKSGGGPCVQAMADRANVRVDDLTRDERWPAFARVAAKERFVSILSIPLMPVADPIGVLNIYSSTRAGFDDDNEKVANLLAHQAAIAIANSDSYFQSEESNDQLRDALVSRDLIGQAKGILMARSAVSGDEAFDQMRSISQKDNRKLRDVAEDIVRGVKGRQTDD